MNQPENSSHVALELGEPGRAADGKPVRLDRRLYMQLLCFGGCPDVRPLTEALSAAEMPAVLYKDLGDPRGVGLLTFSEDPAFFTDRLRDVLAASPFSALPFKEGLTMTGRTYSIGYEQDLEHVLLRRPVQRVLNPDWPWAVWYPLRRAGSFERLEPAEQRDILMEHARLGAMYSEGGHGNDIRLACHGIDRNDNDFVIGLLGPRLYPLSAMVQAMRSTRQTSLHLASLGPFFVGKAVWRSS